jgi:hypothetical protein
LRIAKSATLIIVFGTRRSGARKTVLPPTTDRRREQGGHRTWVTPERRRWDSAALKDARDRRGADTMAEPRWSPACAGLVRIFFTGSAACGVGSGPLRVLPLL